MKIAVLGCGTAGVVSVCHWLHYGIKTEVNCIYDKDIKTLGVGESTNVHLPNDLFLGSGFSMFENSNELDATIKYGVKYTGWNDKDFYSHITPPNYGIHFNNFKLKETIFPRLKNKKFKEIVGHINSMETKDELVYIKINGETYFYDYVIDCRGTPTDYKDYVISDVLPLNHALVHTIEKPGDWNYTKHVATENGWMFGIPLQTRQNYGYMFNDNITTTEEAKKDLSKIFNTELNLKEFKFKPYYASVFLKDRVLKNGNRAIFLEPLEALSGVMYDQINRLMWDHIYNNKSEKILNEQCINISKKCENFIAFVYSESTKFKSKFWEETKKKANKHLTNKNWTETLEFVIRQIKQGALNNGGTNHIAFPFIPLLWKEYLKHFNIKI
tara:strand:+ start:1090 stop:2244 length:1155 start_codon:yes stop_codon:yes gene_type:complete